MCSRTLCSWEVRKIYELPPDDLMEVEAFFIAFGKYLDINGHNLEVIKTRPKSALVSSAFSNNEHEGLNLADTVLIMRSSDVSGITPGESIRVDGQLFRVLTVSAPLKAVVRLDLQGIET